MSGMGFEPEPKWEKMISSIFLLYKNLGENFSKHSTHWRWKQVEDFSLKYDSKHQWQPSE